MLALPTLLINARRELPRRPLSRKLQHQRAETGWKSGLLPPRLPEGRPPNRRVLIEGADLDDGVVRTADHHQLLLGRDVDRDHELDFAARGRVALDERAVLAVLVDPRASGVDESGRGIQRTAHHRAGRSVLGEIRPALLPRPAAVLDELLAGVVTHQVGR